MVVSVCAIIGIPLLLIEWALAPFSILCSFPMFVFLFVIVFSSCSSFFYFSLYLDQLAMFTESSNRVLCRGQPYHVNTSSSSSSLSLSPASPSLPSSSPPSPPSSSSTLCLQKVVAVCYGGAAPSCKHPPPGNPSIHFHNKEAKTNIFWFLYFTVSWLS